MSALLMETTQIAAEKTAAEICQKLVKGGARQILTEYDATAKPTAIRFVISVDGGERTFGLPARVDPVYQYFYNRARKAGYVNGQKLALLKAKAERVAWRQLLRWVEAQIAMIQTGMVKTEEVFLPYMIDMQGKTVFELFAASKFRAIVASVDVSRAIVAPGE